MATSDAVRGAGLLSGFWKRVEGAVRKAGGTDEHLARLDKDETMPAIEQFATSFVYGSPTNVDWFMLLIKLGDFDLLYGWGNLPEMIRQDPHLGTSKVELVYPNESLAVWQVHDRYGESMADLSQLLSYVIRRPEDQREFEIGIIRLAGSQFWEATLYGDKFCRRLRIFPIHPVQELPVSCRFLRRKSTGA